MIGVKHGDAVPLGVGSADGEIIALKTFIVADRTDQLCRFGSALLPVFRSAASRQQHERQNGKPCHWPKPGSPAIRTASFAAASRALALASHSRCS